MTGHYEIGWVLTRIDNEENYFLSEYGGKNSLDFGGRILGVIREIE
ncbi:hypothetical protein [Rummeliibacillus stabekisii]|nr:hypothetical protein [Rummeliibacillus stabekisii]